MTEKTRATFHYERDSYLLKRLKNQQLLGKRTEHGFQKESWATVSSEFNAHFRLNYNKGQLKARYNQLRVIYKQMTQLRTESGFTWDPTSMTVTAPEDVWTEFLKNHSKFAKLRGKPFRTYKDMEALFDGREITAKLETSPSNAGATGDNELDVVENVELDVEGRTPRAEGPNAASATLASSAGPSATVPSISSTSATAASAAETSTRRPTRDSSLPCAKRVRTSSSRDIKEALSAIFEQAKANQDSILAGQGSLPSRRTKLEDAMIKAQEMNFLTDEGLLVLGELFISDERHASIFNSLQAHMVQVKWLKRNLTQDGLSESQLFLLEESE